MKPRWLRPGLLLPQEERSNTYLGIYQNYPAPKSELDMQEQASWPQFDPSNSSVMVLGSDEVGHLISTMMMKLCQLTSSASPESVLLWKSLVWQPLIQTIQVGWGGGDETNDDCNLYHDHNRDTGEEEEIGVQETF